MKAILLIALVAPVLALADVLPAWPLLKLNNGTEYRNVKVTAVDAGGIKIAHADGVARVPETQLPAEVHSQFTFDPAKAAAEAKERKERDAAARVKQAAKEAAMSLSTARAQAREELTYGFRSFRFDHSVRTGGCMAYRHEKGGAVGEVGLATRAIVDNTRKILPPGQSLYVDAAGTDYSAPVFIEGTGDFAEGEIVGGFVADLGTKEIDGRKVRCIALKPGTNLKRN